MKDALVTPDGKIRRSKGSTLRMERGAMDQFTMIPCDRPGEVITVKAEDGATYILRENTTLHIWQLVLFDSRGWV